MLQCTYKFKSGKRKGENCGKLTLDNNAYCARHNKTENSVGINAQQLLASADTIEVLSFKLLSLKTSPENIAVILKKFRYLESLSPTSNEYQKNINWLRHALNFPFGQSVPIPVVMTNNETTTEIAEYLSNVYDKLDAYIYGMHEVKEELLSFVCKRISNPNSVDHILALQGKNGIGKTRLAHGLAKALDLPIRTINLGSVNDVGSMVGHAFTFVESEPGRIVQILSETNCSNPIIYFDELDKIHKTEKGSAINGFLTHAIDSSQNQKFQDNYLNGLTLDISKVFFVFSFNDESNLDQTVKDRLKIIRIKEPSFEEKIQIATKFLIPEICENLKFDINLDKNELQTHVSKIVKRCENKNGLREIKHILEDFIGCLNVKRLMNGISKRSISYFGLTTDRIVDNIIDRHLRNDDIGQTAMMYM